MVWAEDPETGERALKRVVCLFRNEKYELVHLQVKGETITTTVGHPFFVQGKGWVAAKELVVGDKLELLDGGEALPAYPTKWNLNCWRTLRLERAGIRWKEAKRTQATPRALHMRKVIQPKLLKAFTSIASALICDLLLHY